jgi:hypothetical protein
MRHLRILIYVITFIIEVYDLMHMVKREWAVDSLGQVLNSIST